MAKYDGGQTYFVHPNHLGTNSAVTNAAGNLTADGTGPGTHVYQWDAEGRLAKVDPSLKPPTVSLTYNALGFRAEKLIPNYKIEYLFHSDGRELGQFDGNNSAWWSRNVTLGDRSLAIYFSNYVRFLHANHLGTTTVVTNGTGAPLQDQLFYPWGQQWTYAGAQHDLHFASLQQIDPDLGTYPTPNRNYSPTEGRWLSPDPDNAGADGSDPQTWNAYAYVGNSPTSRTDPTGEKYKVCQIDSNGNSTNCADISDEQFAQFQQENKDTLTFTGSGNVLQNGTVIGSYQQTSVDLSPFASDVIAGVNASHPGDFIAGVAGASVIAGTGVGLGLYATSAGAGLTTLTISAATAGPLVTDPDLERIVNWMFQVTDRLPGGTAGAVRYELMTGDTVGGSSHLQKASDIIQGLTRLLKSGQLSLNDQITARALIQELQGALTTKR